MHGAVWAEVPLRWLTLNCCVSGYVSACVNGFCSGWACRTLQDRIVWVNMWIKHKASKFRLINTMPELLFLIHFSVRQCHCGFYVFCSVIKPHSPFWVFLCNKKSLVFVVYLWQCRNGRKCSSHYWLYHQVCLSLLVGLRTCPPYSFIPLEPIHCFMVLSCRPLQLCGPMSRILWFKIPIEWRVPWKSGKIG